MKNQIKLCLLFLILFKVSQAKHLRFARAVKDSDNQCPAGVNPDCPDLNPNKDDCHSFDQCSNGIIYKMPCASNLVYSPKKCECDYEDKVDDNQCGGRTTQSEETTTEVRTTEQPTTQSDEEPTTQGNNENQCPAGVNPECPDLNPNKDDCHSFDQCSNGIIYKMPCASNLVYSPKKCQCDYEDQVEDNQCAARTTEAEETTTEVRTTEAELATTEVKTTEAEQQTTQSNEETTTQGNDNNNQCPAGVNPDCPDLNPNKDDCHSFDQCSNGIIYKMPCASNLVYSPKKCQCDYEDQVEDNQCAARTTEAEETTTEVRTTEAEQPTTQSNDETTTQGNNDNQCPAGVNPDCPDLNPNKDDCHSFDQCSNGIIYKMPCASNLVYSPKKCQCDYEDQVDDNQCAARTTEAEETTTEVRTTEAEQTTQSNDETTTQGNEKTTTQGNDNNNQCPAGVNPDCPDLNPNKDDCHSFDQCSNGIIYKMPCASNLVYSPKKCQCDYEDQVDDNQCAARTTEAVPETTEAEPETTTTVEPEKTTENAPETTTNQSDEETTTQGNSDNQCPAGVNPECPDLNPNKDDCHSFDQCSNGIIYKMPCASNLVYSPKKCQCDYENQVDDNQCAGRTTQSEETTTEVRTTEAEQQTTESNDETTTQGNEETTTQGNEETTTQGNDNNNQCPAGVNPDCPDLNPNKDDCHSFDQCSNGIIYKMPCASNLVYSPKKCQCDYEDQVDDNQCAAKTTEAATTEAVTETEADTTTNGPDSTTQSDDETTTQGNDETTTQGNNDNQCPAGVNPECPDLNPNKDDCHSFDQCSNGIIYKMHCASNLVYSPKKCQCDYEDQVDDNQCAGQAATSTANPTTEAETEAETTEAPTTQAPTTTEQPTTTTEEPTTTEEVTTQETTEEPTTTQAPTTTTEEATTTQRPTTTQEPTTTQAPTTTTQVPTTTEELTTQETTTQETTEEPTTTQAPTTTRAPTTTEEPTTTRAPTTTEEPTTTRAPTTTQAPTTTTRRPTTTTASSGGDFRCPRPNDSNYHHTWLYPDPDNCRYFYHCTQVFEPKHKICPANLYFDKRLRVCNWQNAADTSGCRRPTKEEGRHGDWQEANRTPNRWFYKSK